MKFLLTQILYVFLSVIDICAFAPGIGGTRRSYSLQPSPRSALFVSSESDISESIQASKSSSSSSLSSSSSSPSSKRRIESVERFSRLPIWPVWNGVFLFVVSRILGKDIAANLEDAIGGRVCPNFFQNTDRTSPFLMLVHHRHSFAAWDPLRYIQRTFFPEGFPAHPHRGFVTVTYFLRGGFLHRDSAGVKQTYGAEERHGGKHTQYLMTGAGLLHEEMFDIKADNALGVSGQELYQLWLNIPSKNKFDTPFSQLLGGEDETPTVVSQGPKGSVETIIIAGEFGGRKSSARTYSDVSIFHVTLAQGSRSTWNYNLPQTHRTALLYLRRGSVIIDGERIGPHNTVYFDYFGNELMIESEKGADFLFLSGEPLNEPVAAQGSMVMNSGREIGQAYADYQAGKMGAPWSEKLTNDEWEERVKKFPNMYRHIEK